MCENGLWWVCDSCKNHQHGVRHSWTAEPDGGATEAVGFWNRGPAAPAEAAGVDVARETDGTALLCHTWSPKMMKRRSNF